MKLSIVTTAELVLMKFLSKILCCKSSFKNRKSVLQPFSKRFRALRKHPSSYLYHCEYAKRIVSRFDVFLITGQRIDHDTLTILTEMPCISSFLKRNPNISPELLKFTFCRCETTNLWKRKSEIYGKRASKPSL